LINSKNIFWRKSNSLDSHYTCIFIRNT